MVLSERRGFKQSLQKMFLRHLLDSRKQPQLLKDCRRGFNHSIQKKDKELPPVGFEPRPSKWQEEMITITPCHSPKAILCLLDN